MLKGGSVGVCAWMLAANTRARLCIIFKKTHGAVATIGIGKIMWLRKHTGAVAAKFLWQSNGVCKKIGEDATGLFGVCSTIFSFGGICLQTCRKNRIFFHTDPKKNEKVVDKLFGVDYNGYTKCIAVLIAICRVVLCCRPQNFNKSLLFKQKQGSMRTRWQTAPCFRRSK